MSILNYNNALTANFRITFPRIQNLEFYAMSVNIPTTQLSAIEVNYRDTRAKVPDDKFIWDDVTIQFMMDEDLYSYELLKDWLDHVRNDGDWLGALRDIVIQPLDSNKNLEFAFKLENAFPTVINGWQYNSTLITSENIVFDVTFAFQHFEIKRLNQLDFSII